HSVSPHGRPGRACGTSRDGATAPSRRAAYTKVRCDLALVDRSRADLFLWREISNVGLASFAVIGNARLRGSRPSEVHAAATDLALAVVTNLTSVGRLKSFHHFISSIACRKAHATTGLHRLVKGGLTANMGSKYILQIRRIIQMARHQPPLRHLP